MVVSLTEVEEENVFKSCCDIWLGVAKDLADQRQAGSGAIGQTGYQNQSLTVEQEASRQSISAFNVLLMRTPKPQEVFIIIDDDGLPKRAQILTENTQLFEQLRKIYQTMAQFAWSQIHEIVCLKVEGQKNPSNWSYNSLNSICWTTGCFAGHIPAQQEQSVFVTVLRSLLEFIKFKQSHEDKMVIASNIMYLISSFKNYLNQNRDFLDIVIKKLMEFIGEDIHSNVPEMAINSILTITQNIKLGIQQGNQEQKSFLEFIQEFERMRRNLQSNKMLEGCLYETAGNIIFSLNDP